MKGQGYDERYRLQLLQDVSGAFRPGVLTALLGITGAGKTTLLDVLAGKKTSGYIEDSITVSGYPKNQETFARICGYCEQNDIHSPCITVYESLVFSAWLRLSSNIDVNTRMMFIEEVMRLVELEPLKDAIVGLTRISGLSAEQRKRLTIAVELVANPSIMFMDEPTSGLDARAAAIVMRTMRNVVNNGRTVVCTIHQPSIVIFEAFDELLLIKRGGRLIYAGPLGDHSSKLIEYFEAIPGVPKIKDSYNPATWMLDITSTQVESQMGLDFAEIYVNSQLYRAKQQDLMNLFEIMFSTILFLGGTSALNVQAVVASERAIFYREKAARMYSALPFTLAQLAIEAIYVAIVNFVYCLLLYSMIGFEWTIGKFFYFYFIFMSFTYYTMFGMMLVSLTPRQEISAIFLTLFATLWNLFAGFFLPRTLIPIWWRWFYWASPVSWTMYGLLTSQIGDKNNLVEILEVGNVPLNLLLKEMLGYEYHFLPFVAVAHIAWVLLFSFVFAFGIKFLNFQQR
uniref:ABC transporter domain-containing protein n=1 Tax=Chenopodium quinoa TaxID=63459 RepID=A0A803MQJ2_CHEQI